MEAEIERELLREKEMAEDRRLPISGYSYSVLRDRLAKKGIEVSLRPQAMTERSTSKPTVHLN